MQFQTLIFGMIAMIFNTSKVVRLNYWFPCVRMIPLYLKYSLPDEITGNLLKGSDEIKGSLAKYIIMLLSFRSGRIQSQTLIFRMIPMICNTSKVVRLNYRFPCVRMIPLYLK